MRSTTVGQEREQERAPAALADAATPDAQLAFLRSSLPRIHGWLLARCGDRALAEDLLSETILAAANHMKRSPKSELSTAWLLTVAQNKYVDSVRRSVRERQAMARVVDDASEATDPADEWLPAPTRERTLAALATVPAAQRGVLVLHYLEGLPVAGVAETIGRSMHATESLLARGRASFRIAYQREAAGDE